MKLQSQERRDRDESGTSPVQVSRPNVDDRSRRPDDNHANKSPKTNKEETAIERGDPLCSEIPEWMRIAESLDGAKDVVPAAQSTAGIQKEDYAANATTELAAVKRGYAVANGGGL